MHLSSYLLMGALLVACQRNPEPEAEPLPEVQAQDGIISAHTDGTISRKSDIRVRFVEDLPVDTSAPVDPTLLSITPRLDGTLRWESARELVFTPSGDLPAGKTLSVSVALAKLRPEWASEAFSFNLRVIEQRIRIERDGLEADSTDGRKQRFTGQIITSDVADSAKLEAALSARHGKDTLKVAWQHSGLEHTFTVTGIQRTEGGSELELTLDGEKLGIAQSLQDSIAVPALDRFALVTARPISLGERHIELRFSDPIDADQDLRGLIRLSGHGDLRFTVDNSTVQVYSPTGFMLSETLTISGLKSAAGRPLAEDITQILSFAPIKPAVRFLGRGTIFPTTEDLTVPIEVTNLRSVRVEAMRVHEDNVPQLLQVGELDSDREMSRVGRVIWRKTVEIEQSADRINRPVSLGLDVSELIADNRSGLYRLKLTFDREDILYDCPALSDLEIRQRSDELEQDWEGYSNESSSWDYWGSDGWENREDPCHAGFYQQFYDHDITASRSVLISDIGLMARQGSDGQIVAVVTDLRTAQPLPGAAVELLDFQQQPMDTGTTNASGILTLTTDRKPFVLHATAGDQSAWLKLDRGGSLAMGHFDIAGAPVTEGLKGALYGERGVWRPGDDIHLTFVLFDRESRLPEDHPVLFELRDPHGQLIEKRTLTDGLNGFYALSTRTDADALTGNYTARVSVGGATFDKVLRVETIMPNRLKIEMDPAQEILSGAQPRLTAALHAEWLHGATARNLDTAVELTLVPRRTTFAKYDGFTFDDPTASFESEAAEIFKGTLDDSGQVAVDVPIEIPSGAPGMLTAKMRTRVFEPGGAASMDEFSIPVSPHERYIGIKTPKGDAARGMLLTDVAHTVEIAAVDASGQPVADGQVELALYKISWRWWWESGSEDLAEYAGTQSHESVASGTATINNGRATWDFQVDYPQWGRYLLLAKDPGGHTTGKVLYIDWPGWAGRGQKENPGGASVLSLSTDRQEAEVGEKVTLNIPTSGAGRVLVTLESGTRVIKADWVVPEGDTTTYTFTATPEMAPGIYANVTLLQPHASTENDLPIRLYGVQPIAVVDPTTKLSPEIQTAAVFEPQSTATVTVRESGGRPMTYTLAIVDEGLLGLTRFETPDLWSGFYAREALGVRSWDLFDLVAGAYGGALEGMLAIGGDGVAEEVTPPKANRFPPMVRFEGPFELEDGGVATHHIDIPQYIGEVRVMVVAGDDGAFGRAERSVKVKRPLMVLAGLPRVLGPQEELDLPISVFALEDSIKNVTVEVEVEGPLELVGEDRRKLTFTQSGDQTVDFGLRVAGELGVGRVHVTATSGSQVAEQTIEIDVRHPGVEAVAVLGGEVAPGQDWGAMLSPVGLVSTNTAMLELSRVPPMDLDRQLDGLIHYPHGCVEQTTSGAFPQLYLTGLLDLPAARQAEVRSNINTAIDRLRRFQTRSGGFAYWPGMPEADDWGSSYAGHFLVEAERAGYLLPSGLKADWVAYQKDRASRWVRQDQHSDLEQAYRLYTLALAGEPAMGAMNRLKSLPLSSEVTWRLAAAYQLAGQGEVARSLTRGLSQEVRPYSELTGTYGSDLRDLAMILESSVLIGLDSGALARRVSAGLTANAHSTQTTAYALLALARFAGADRGSPAAYAYSVGDAQASGTLSRPITQIPLSQTSGRLSVSNGGSTPLFVRVIQRGLPEVGKDEASASGLELTVTYRDSNSKPVDPLTLPQGTDFEAVITVKNPTASRLDELALTQIVPSGWEIHSESSGTGEDYDYREVRDDRVHTYFDLAGNASVTFTVNLHASYQGEYYLPPVHVEAMYDPTIHARELGQWIKVVEDVPEG